MKVKSTLGFRHRRRVIIILFRVVVVVVWQLLIIVGQKVSVEILTRRRKRLLACTYVRTEKLIRIPICPLSGHELRVYAKKVTYTIFYRCLLAHSHTEFATLEKGRRIWTTWSDRGRTGYVTRSVRNLFTVTGTKSANLMSIFFLPLELTGDVEWYVELLDFTT